MSNSDPVAEGADQGVSEIDAGEVSNRYLLWYEDSAGEEHYRSFETSQEAVSALRDLDNDPAVDLSRGVTIDLAQIVGAHTAALAY